MWREWVRQFTPHTVSVYRYLLIKPNRTVISSCSGDFLHYHEQVYVASAHIFSAIRSINVHPVHPSKCINFGKQVSNVFYCPPFDTSRSADRFECDCVKLTFANTDNLSRILSSLVLDDVIQFHYIHSPQMPMLGSLNCGGEDNLYKNF